MPVRHDLKRPDGVLLDREVHVWHADLRAAEEDNPSLISLLDGEETQRAARFKVESAHKQFVTSHAFTRLALAPYLGIRPTDIRFKLTEHGKPEIVDHPLPFNLSHTDSNAVVAITAGPAVGVDVERVRQNVEALDLAKRFFSAPEVEWLRSQPSAETANSFFSCWTAKEAYIKACGIGLSMPLAEFSLIPRGDDQPLELKITEDSGRSKAWSVWPLDLGAELRAAVAVEAENVIVRVGNWAWMKAVNDSKLPPG